MLCGLPFLVNAAGVGATAPPSTVPFGATGG